MNKLITTVKRIGNQPVDYIFARDISKDYEWNISLYQEFNLSRSKGNEEIINENPSRICDMVGSSIIPNLMHCAGLSASLYLGDATSIYSCSLTAEAIRLFFRHNSRKENKNYRKFMQEIGIMTQRILTDLEAIRGRSF